MSLNRIVLLPALLAPAAFAQGWSQPVREMEREARSFFSGRCVSLGRAQTNCVFTHGAAATMTVPAGKIMVIEDTSGLVKTSSTTALFSDVLRADTGSGAL